MKAHKDNLKQEFIDELRLFFIYFIFLTLFLWTFTMYRRLILKEYQIAYVHYSYNFVEALILSKTILLGQKLKLGEKFSGPPLIIPTLYKTVIFSLFILVFTVIEEFVLGYFKGKHFTEVYQELADVGFDEILARVLVMFFVFVLLFAFLEIERLMGDDNLFNLFLRRKNKNSSAS